MECCTITWTKVLLFTLLIKQALSLFFHLIMFTPPTYFSSQEEEPNSKEKK